MKTLTESIINELRLSKVSTGDKLEEKTFGELKEGDYIWAGFFNHEKRFYLVVYKINRLKSVATPKKVFDVSKKTEYWTDIAFDVAQENVGARWFGCPSKTMAFFDINSEYYYFASKSAFQKFLKKTKGLSPNSEKTYEKYFK